MDSPPLASVTDAVLLARSANLVLFVVQHNKVDKRLIKRSLLGFRKANPQILGVVLNAVDLDVQGRYYSNYYYYQYRHPRGGEDAAEARAPDAGGVKL